MLKGDVFAHAYAVTREVYDSFISLFGDRNPLHTDAGFAMGKGFKGKVMHGNILNGFLSHFIGEVLPSRNVIIQNQEIKYYKPVYLNDALTLSATIEDVHESVNAITFKFLFTNADGIKVAGGKFMIGTI